MKNQLKGILIYILISVFVLVMIGVYHLKLNKVEEYTISELVKQIDNKEIVNLRVEGNWIKGETKDKNQFRTYVPSALLRSLGDDIFKKIKNKELSDVKGIEPAGRPIILDLIFPIFLLVIFIIFWKNFMDSASGNGKMIMNFGKSKAKLQKEDDTNITFSDVAGLKEEKAELEEVVDFLKSPTKYTAMGARIPKGVLMVGPPGTGKTYLSKAVAGEAKVPFFNVSGSEFVEMYVGVGASRVREMFNEAKKSSPCIVFIDEIDAVGRRRSTGYTGGHEEREQTLNQLLVEMDGFEKNEGIIVIAATNRSDILDPALLRPGRFDREIKIGLPDILEREDILKIHSKNKPIDKNVNFKVIARGTTGFTPADLENAMNEAAILSARKGEKTIDMESIEGSITKLIMGVEKKTRVMNEKEIKITAYHEAGHAVLAKLEKEADPVHQVTIIPRGDAGGFTLMLPEEDTSYASKEYLKAKLVVALGGRIAEKLIMGDITTGASSDLKNVTRIAKAMVTRYAMSEKLSSMSFEEEDNGSVMMNRSISENTMFDIDKVIKQIVDDAYNRAEKLLTDNIQALHNVAKALIEFETISGAEFEAAFEKGSEAVSEMREKNGGKMEYSLFNNAKEEVQKELEKEEQNNEEQNNQDKEKNKKEESKDDKKEE